MRTLAALFLFVVPLPAQKHPITHPDVWQMKRVGSPAVSPDGKWAVVPVNEPNYDAAKTTSDLWLVPLDGSAAPRRLTNTHTPEENATFSPDSTRLAFATKREGDDQPQVYILSLSGGDAQRITKVTNGVSDPQWRPDGKAILFQSRVFPGAINEADNQRIAADRKARKYNMRVFDSFPIRHWDHWLDDLRPHIFVQALDPTAAPRDLLASTKLAAQPGFNGEEGLANPDLQAVWSPEGASIVFTATVEQNKAAYGPVPTHLYLVSAQGGEPAPLTSGADSYSKPQFSPDGRTLYAVHHRVESTTLYSLGRLVKIDWPDGAGHPKYLTPGWDRSVQDLAIAPGGRRLYITAEEYCHDKLFTVPSTGGTPTPVLDVKEGGYSGLTMSKRAAKPLLVALWGSMIHPEDLVVVDPESRERRFLSAFNKDRIDRIDWLPPREFWFTAKSGKGIQSLIVLPPNFDPAKKYPLVVFPHGGPHNMIKDQFFFRWNYHLLTSPGYVLLMTNYTGSTGYGEAFAAAIHQDILRETASEIEQAADEAIRAYSFIDGSRQAAVGASYGGYLMNWFEGNTHRFKCLVNHAGLTGNESFWGATDGAYYWERRNGGPVWEQQGVWRDQSPAAYAANFATPMLITHGEKDFRVPINQAFEIYKLLQRRQVPSRLVIFPDASHWVLKGEDARQHMREVLDWLKKYI